MARKRGNGQGGLRLRGKIWWILFRKGGRQIQMSSKNADLNGGKTGNGQSKEVAQRLLQAQMVDTSRGATPQQDIKSIRYEDIRDAWLRDNPKRVEGEKYKLVHLNDFFSGQRVMDIKPDTLRDYIEERREEEMTDPTIRRELVDLRAMFYLAQEDEKIDSVPHFPMPDDSPSAATYIEPQQFAKILAGLETVRQEKQKAEPQGEFGDLRAFFTFLYGTACRSGAAQAITLNMVSDDGKEIRIPAALIKNRVPHDVSLTGALLAPLAEQLKIAKRKAFDKSVPAFNSTNYRPDWSKACAKAGLGMWDQKTRTRTGSQDMTNVRIHDCRGSGAANLVDAGVPEGQVMQIAGWKTRVMLDRYVKLTPKGRQRAMEQAGNYVHAAMNGTK